jgi:hypothetical protein
MSPPNYPYGTAEYFPDLLNRVQDALPSQTIDLVLLEALLLALASGPRHLCIRTDAASIPRVAAAATSVRNTAIPQDERADGTITKGSCSRPCSGTLLIP